MANHKAMLYQYLNYLYIFLFVLLTFLISFIFVNCRPNSQRSTPNLSAQFRTLKIMKKFVVGFIVFKYDTLNMR